MISNRTKRGGAAIKEYTYVQKRCSYKSEGITGIETTQLLQTGPRNGGKAVQNLNRANIQEFVESGVILQSTGTRVHITRGENVYEAGGRDQAGKESVKTKEKPETRLVFLASGGMLYGGPQKRDGNVSEHLDGRTLAKKVKVRSAER